MKNFSLLLILFYTLLGGCREPYDPALENNIKSHLVVEGMINANGVSTIELTRTTALSGKIVKQQEKAARLIVEGDNNTTFNLTEQTDGVYVSGANILPVDRKFRLRITTSDGKVYLSDYAAVKTSPAVEVGWNQHAAGVDITASSSDPSSPGRYYHWTTEETWEIHSSDRSSFQTVGNPISQVVRISSAEEIENRYTCWITRRSEKLLIASTVGQSSDVIEGLKLVEIPNGSDKLSVKYSVQVWQYAISKEAFDFYELMKRNTEQMGSLFDPQPTFIRGNIRSLSDPKEIVIGFVECSSGTGKRIFITKEEANNWQEIRECQLNYVQNSLIELRRVFGDGKMLIASAEVADFPSANGGEVFLGFNYTYNTCLDCRLRGTNTRPVFW